MLQGFSACKVEQARSGLVMRLLSSKGVSPASGGVLFKTAYGPASMSNLFPLPLLQSQPHLGYDVWKKILHSGCYKRAGMSIFV